MNASGKLDMPNNQLDVRRARTRYEWWWCQCTVLRVQAFVRVLNFGYSDMKDERKSKACDLFHRDAAPEENHGTPTC
jgi:hypothetical protein